ncbi:MAG: hypothetical protein KDD51_15550, partial [Bdellovibrionales bacterium]|nr:hypothetical protein [Bdellovibrionales bacterium]
VSASEAENTLVLWSTTREFEPVRLRAESVGRIRSLRFLNDDNSQILMETYNGVLRGIYLVDVFKMRAALRNQARE